MDQFYAAAFPRLIQLRPNLNLAPAASGNSDIAGIPPLLLTRQEHPVRVLPLVNSRPAIVSIDKIQAAGNVETDIVLEQRALSGSNYGFVVSTNATTALSTQVPPAEAKTAPLASGKADHSKWLDPKRSAMAASQLPSTENPAVESWSSGLPSEDDQATDLFVTSLSRSKPSAENESHADGSEYLSGVQNAILSAAAVATALVLPGIISEIRRRRKSVLPQFARESRQQADSDALKEQAATYPIREKAG